jgi:hypothetical protein
MNCATTLSLGVFLNNPHQILASFAVYGFKTGNNILAGILLPTSVYSPPPLKAGYTAPSFHQYAGFLTIV